MIRRASRWVRTQWVALLALFDRARNRHRLRREHGVQWRHRRRPGEDGRPRERRRDAPRRSPAGRSPATRSRTASARRPRHPRQLAQGDRHRRSRRSRASAAAVALGAGGLRSTDRDRRGRAAADRALRSPAGRRHSSSRTQAPASGAAVISGGLHRDADPRSTARSRGSPTCTRRRARRTTRRFVSELGRSSATWRRGRTPSVSSRSARRSATRQTRPTIEILHAHQRARQLPRRESIELPD